jgi:glycerate kinase
VAEAAQERGLPCLVLAGRVTAGRREAAAVGVTEAHSLVEHLGSAERAMAEAADGLAGLAARLARQWSRT